MLDACKEIIMSAKLDFIQSVSESLTDLNTCMLVVDAIDPTVKIEASEDNNSFVVDDDLTVTTANMKDFFCEFVQKKFVGLNCQMTASNICKQLLQAYVKSVSDN